MGLDDALFNFTVIAWDMVGGKMIGITDYAFSHTYGKKAVCATNKDSLLKMISNASAASMASMAGMTSKLKASSCKMRANNITIVTITVFTPPRPSQLSSSSSSSPTPWLEPKSSPPS